MPPAASDRDSPITGTCPPGTSVATAAAAGRGETGAWCPRGTARRPRRAADQQTATRSLPRVSPTSRPSTSSSTRSQRRARRVVVRHDQEGGHAEVAVEGAQQREDRVGARRVEVAGRLVGEHERRAHRERPRHRDPLLLPAGELAGAPAEEGAEADLAEQLRGARAHPLVGPAAVEEQRHHHVLERRERRQQVVELEDEADAAPAQAGQPRLVEGAGVLAADADASPPSAARAAP